MNTLYKIWRRNPITGEEYPLEYILSVIDLYRDEVVSVDFDKLQAVADRLNYIAGDDERYDVREWTDDPAVIERIQKIFFLSGGR